MANVPSSNISLLGIKREIETGNYSSSNSYNALLESGGSLYGNGSDNSAFADNPLSDSSCIGY